MLEEALADVARGHTDDGVVGRIVGRGPAEECDADAAFPQVHRFAMKRMFDDVFQEGLATMAALEGGALDDLIQVSPHSASCLTASLILAMAAACVAASTFPAMRDSQW